MRTIKNRYTIIDKIIGIQTIENEKCYKHSIYSRLISTKNGEKLWYNVFTGEILFLNENEAKFLQFDKKKYSNEMDEFIKKHFLVPCDLNEYNLCKSTKSVADILSQSNSINSYTILTTTDCNARCYYCYELNCERRFMDEKTSIDVADYIIKNYKNQKIHINWFGGEPLYNYKVINTISNILKNANIDFDSSMISNGYLFDDFLINQAKNEWNLKWIQITLDGTEQIYNKTKAYIYKDTNPFKIVLDNIEKLINSKIKVRIRFNLSKHNFEDLKELANYLYVRFGRNKFMCVYASLLLDPSKKVSSADFNRLFELEDYIENLGIFAKINMNNRYVSTACSADSDSDRFITPTGDIGICHNFCDTNIVGNIYNEKLDTDLLNAWKKTIREQERCGNCLFYPECKRLVKCPNNLLICTNEQIKKKIRYLDNSINWYYEKNYSEL